MSFMDWFILIGLCIAGVEVLALVGMVAWWFASTFSEIRRIDEEIRSEALRRGRARIRGEVP